MYKRYIETRERINNRLFDNNFNIGIIYNFKNKDMYDNYIIRKNNIINNCILSKELDRTKEELKVDIKEYVYKSLKDII